MPDLASCTTWPATVGYRCFDRLVVESDFVRNGICHRLVALKTELAVADSEDRDAGIEKENIARDY